jgi:hypothetical protein
MGRFDKSPADPPTHAVRHFNHTFMNVQKNAEAFRFWTVNSV